MEDDPKTSSAERADDPSPKMPKPEEMGRDGTRTSGAIEPEAIRTVSDGAVQAGDRMWGPAGAPSPED